LDRAEPARESRRDVVELRDREQRSIRKGDTADALPATLQVPTPS
jgi:hypothetical protein